MPWALHKHTHKRTSHRGSLQLYTQHGAPHVQRGAAQCTSHTVAGTLLHRQHCTGRLLQWGLLRAAQTQASGSVQCRTRRRQQWSSSGPHAGARRVAWSRSGACMHYHRAPPHVPSLTHARAATTAAGCAPLYATSSSSSNSPSSSADASWYCWYSDTRSFMLDSASVNSISSMPSPVYQ